MPREAAVRAAEMSGSAKLSPVRESVALSASTVTYSLAMAYSSDPLARRRRPAGLSSAVASASSDGSSSEAS